MSDCGMLAPPELRHFRLPLLASSVPQKVSTAASAGPQRHTYARSQRPVQPPCGTLSHKVLDFPRLANAVLASRRLSGDAANPGTFTAAETAAAAARPAAAQLSLPQSNLKKQMGWLSTSERQTFSMMLSRNRRSKPLRDETLGTGVRWTLHPTEHSEAQVKRQRQGPYSREFLVTCSAPTSWMRQKLGRSRTAKTTVASALQRPHDVVAPRFGVSRRQPKSLQAAAYR